MAEVAPTQVGSVARALELVELVVGGSTEGMALSEMLLEAPCVKI